MAATDGGHVWPPRASDPRIQELAGGAYVDAKPGGVFKALRTMGYTGSIDDMWAQHKVAKSAEDTSEPFTGSLAPPP